LSIAQLLPIPYVGALFDAIPDTDLAECRRAIDDGRYIDASFACPAGTFLRELVGAGPGDDEEDDFDEEDDT
jgi:hypothetical protein